MLNRSVPLLAQMAAVLGRFPLGSIPIPRIIQSPLSPPMPSEPSPQQDDVTTPSLAEGFFLWQEIDYTYQTPRLSTREDVRLNRKHFKSAFK
jgi:hypothetical protein